MHSLDSWKSKWPGNIILLYFIDLLGDKKRKRKKIRDGVVPTL